jgi:hypothetical protein
MELDIPKPKCYLVCGEMDYEPHDFEYAKVFFNKADAESYVKEILEKKSYYGYPEIIELDILVKH